MLSKIPEAWLGNLGLHRKELRAWALYDWANSAFVTTVIAAVLPIYFSDVAASNLPENLRTAIWGYTSAAALLIAAVISPFLGALADMNAVKKKLLALFIAFGVVSCFGLSFAGPGDWMLVVLLFILGNVGFSAGEVFYEALLPHIASVNEMDRVSTAGYALGYIGGGILLAINLAWIQFPETFGFSGGMQAVQITFVSVGVWWFVFSVPLFRHVPEPNNKVGHAGGKRDLRATATAAILQLKSTCKELMRYRQVLIFLGAFWLYSDGIGTIYKMAAIYGREIGIGKSHLIGALLMVQFLGIPFTFLFGWLAGRIGSKRGVIVCLSWYTVVCMFGYYMTTALHFWILAIGVALVQGGCQGLSRSIFASIIPKQQSAEFFGFFSISSKFAGLIGPAVFGLFGQLFGNSRYSILFLVTFFIGGILLLLLFDLDEARRVARARESEAAY